MQATATDCLNLRNLPREARTCHKFDKFHLPLVSVPKLCAHCCTVHFGPATVNVTKNGQVILTGTKTPPHLKLPRAARLLQKSFHSSNGHMHMLRKHIRSSQPPPDNTNTNPPAPWTPASRTRHVAIEIINTISDKEFQNLIPTDLPSRYPITSLRGHKYLLFDTNSDFINAVPIKNRSTLELLNGFKHCHKYLKRCRFRAKLLRLDNEVS